MGLVLTEDGKGIDWRDAVGPAAIALVALWALSRSWAFGPDIQVDFGRELYVPWRLVAGARLYEDVAFFNGPLSVYWHALWFEIAGVGLQAIKISNLLIAGLIAGLIYKLTTRLADAVAATAATLLFVGAIAFGQFQPIANYNYLTPYSHELVHGVALSLFALLWFAKQSQGGERARTPVLLGALLGLVFFTKIEVFAALSAALGTGIALELWLKARLRAQATRWLLRFVCGFGAVIVVGLIALAAMVGAAAAIAGVFEPVRAIFATDVTSLPYYRWVMGTADVAKSLRDIAQWHLYYAAVLLPLIGLAFAVAAFGRSRGKGNKESGKKGKGKTKSKESQIALRRVASERENRIAGALGLVFVVLAVVFPLAPDWAVRSIRPLPVLVPLAIIGLVVRMLRVKNAAYIPHVCVLVFGFALQSKMLLNAQFGHYGFALLLPSALALVVALVSVAPMAIERAGGSGAIFRLGACALVFAVALGLNERTEANRARRTQPVGRDADVMISDFRAMDVTRALAWLAETEPEATVAVLPEGVMLNYLSRRESPTRYINFMPPELSLYTSAAIIEAFEQSPPDYVLLVHKRTGLYGTPFFGRDYGRALYGWVRQNYQMVETFGGVPFAEKTRFGISMLVRNYTPVEGEAVAVGVGTGVLATVEVDAAPDIAADEDAASD